MDKTGRDVAEHLAHVTPLARRRDAQTLIDLMREVTDREPEMWSAGIIGFGACRYAYPTGTEGVVPIVAFAARKPASTLYVFDDVATHDDALAALGPHTRSKGCLYIKDLTQVDLDVLRGIIEATYAHVVAGGSGYAEYTVLE